MSQSNSDTVLEAPTASTAPVDTASPAYQAYQLLRLAFVAAPIIAGIDKYLHLLVDWDQYLAPWLNHLVGGHGHALMLAVGVIEVIAGLGVAWKPRLFAYVVAAWLAGIVINLLTFSGWYDIALRDFGLMLGAIALGRLAQVYDRS